MRTAGPKAGPDAGCRGWLGSFMSHASAAPLPLRGALEVKQLWAEKGLFCKKSAGKAPFLRNVGPFSWLKAVDRIVSSHARGTTRTHNV